MRVLLFTSAAVAAVLVGAPAWAGSGQVDASYGAIAWDADAWNADGYQTSLGGAFAAPIGGQWNLQFDARANSVASYDGEVVENAGSHAAVHAFRRTEGYSVGGFAGQMSYGRDAGMFAGVEGQAYLSNVTLSASTGYGHFQRWGEYGVWNVQTGATLFVTDDFALTAGAGWSSWNHGGDDPVWNAGVGAEYKFANSPASVFAAYRHDAVEYEAAPTAGFDRDVISVGVRWNFGADSLKARDRTGASLTGAAALAGAALAW